MTSILVIEDQPDLREDVVEYLSLAGFDAYSAPNGRVGVQVAQERLPDIIVCDIMMPELDGYGVLYELRSVSNTAPIPFIFLTAMADRTHFRKGMELGAHDYLTKPFTQQELLTSVKMAYEKQQTTKMLYGQQAEDLRQNLLQALPHELRTPLTGILGYGEMLVDSYDRLAPLQIRSMAEDIVKSGNRLHQVIENYLLYAQIEIIKTDPARVAKMQNSRVINAGDVIAQLAVRKAAEASRADDLRLNVENVSAAISEDSLRKIAEELVDNAFKFSKGGTCVEVTACAAQGVFSLTIRDYGRGMMVDQIKQIGAYMQFERKLYEQQGLGLGLALTKSVTELYGGKLTLFSELKSGTQVCIELPL